MGRRFPNVVVRQVFRSIFPNRTTKIFPEAPNAVGKFHYLDPY